MEILAPAGSMEQALAAIDGGCDALYGGLKAWNARKRAANFTFEEYRDLLELCHKKKVKFYMTLNIFMTTKEIDELKEVFQSKDFPKPDAVIVADLGVVKMFKDNFPEIPLHASTQFGAYNVDDVKLLEKLGFSRAILARELSLNELKQIKADTNIELEVFTYGSQCIAFSGQCLWGGLLNKTSGNRGECIGMCRDVYSCKGLRGQVMYPQDIDCISLVKDLDELGIASLKIEGRLRKPDAVQTIIKNYKSAKMGDLDSVSENYIGYFSNQLPVKKMLNIVNPRNKYNLENTKLSFEYLQLDNVIDMLDTHKNQISYETNSAEDVKDLINANVKTVIFALTNLNELLNVLQLDTKHTNIIFKLPLLDFGNGLERMLPLLKEKNVMISRLGQIATAEKFGLNVVAGEYTLNICNNYAETFIKEMGIDTYTYHPESIRFVGKDKKAEVILFGRVPLGYSRACWGEVGCCNQECGHDSFVLHNETKDYELEVVCDNEFGYRTILYKEPFAFALSEPVERIRLILTGLDKEIKECIINGKACIDKKAVKVG